MFVPVRRKTSIPTVRGCSARALRPCRPAIPKSFSARRPRRLVDRTLDALPERTREIFVRSRFRGQSYKEIAAEMGTTVKSVEFEVSKAMKLLRVALKDYLAFFIFWFYIN